MTEVLSMGWHALPGLLVGAVLGFCGGLFGIGGGIIAIPMLVWFYGMDQQMAQGTALVMMVPNLLIGWWRYSRVYPVPWQRALAIGVLACGTTWLVAHWAIGLPSRQLRAIFALFLMVLAWRLLVRWWRSVRSASNPDASTPALPAPRVGSRYIPLVGVVGGSSMGLLGIGGGLVATPLLTGWFGQRQTVAQSLSLALVAPSSIIALSSYAQAHQVNWSMGLPLAVSGMFTVSSGVALAHRLPERQLRGAFAWMLLATGAWLLLSMLL
ncbi:sulfite exporter TauE/SafE family protein [Aquabacterium sp.]|uniref:sulfite exporter TauE/SafE family protein n=1 Tax=Aquabacterium sp. TaxID=1872578 RepID=UPI0035AE9297